MISLNNVVLSSAIYLPANTIILPGTVRVNMQVSIRAGVANSGSIYLQLADPANPSGTSYLQETFFLPGLYSLDRRCAGARIRGATSAGASVTLECLTQGDVGSG